MAQPLSIEHEKWVYLITTRTSGSRLWFIKCPDLEERILGCLARYQARHEVVIYGFILMGNHYHLLARFPKQNRALFMRDFNSAVARLVGRYVKEHGRRSVWARRYSYQVLIRAEDVFHWFMYLSLNPVSSGIVPRIQEYRSYNSYFDASRGMKRSYKWIDWSKYLMQVRFKPSLTEEDFINEYELSYSRLPGYEDLSKEEYQKALSREVEKRQASIRSERFSRGEGFLGLKLMKTQVPGQVPRSSKSSSRYSFRPLVLTLCIETKKTFLSLYFAIRESFTIASRAFRAGDFKVSFPSGTYPPPRLAVV
ncbi:MAG: hypothetical protein DCC75_06190 [Proteobacteria bacterium]|nr:MAG: hypothetical protein DCC75_06190 [Pseudomonadota bacterium]